MSSIYDKIISDALTLATRLQGLRYICQDDQPFDEEYQRRNHPCVFAKHIGDCQQMLEMTVVRTVIPHVN
ncbi:hypothetical protein CHS0354_015016 [Potamilus streckersoni]|uniref:Uncharacterized protein n=1 Tax=Potamilus streckersoni TaxID=2493646 RepID=A0AAE0SNE3_9BIVA|nr:hypothetical protein CHS0354_015016 [Potamilus streckersoni]